MATATYIDEKLAMQYAADLLQRTMLDLGEPAKASEVAQKAERDDVDLRLARVVLATNLDRFASRERRWTLTTRFGDSKHTVDRTIETIVSATGVPVSPDALARELSAVYGQSTEHFEGVLAHVLARPDRFFEVDGAYGLARWLLVTGAEDEDYDDGDVQFFNFVSPELVDALAPGAESIVPGDLATVMAYLDAAPGPVDNKVLQLFAWRADPAGFDARTFYTALLRDGRAHLLADGRWLGPAAVQALPALFEGIAEREVDEHGDAAHAELAQPLVISDEDVQNLVQSVVESETTSRATRILEAAFEVSPGDPTWESDIKTVVDALRQDENLQWVGGDRFLTKDAVPPYIFTVPELLFFPQVEFTDAEGSNPDLLLEDDGFDSALQRDIMSPLAQDVGDEEPAYSPDDDPPSTARCVLKYHHRQIGTFPLCQLPPGFFPVEPAIVQVDVSLPSGQKAEVWINNETRLLYGLLDWYFTLPVDSGVVFYLDRTAPDRYALTYGEETEPAMFVSQTRVNELMELGEIAEAEELPTFEVLRRIMEHYRKGVEFVTLLTEVGIARRTTRRMVASLLSGYTCFFQRGGAWVFDAKKLSQGFDKSKRKYLIR